MTGSDPVAIALVGVLKVQGESGRTVAARIECLGLADLLKRALAQPGLGDA